MAATGVKPPHRHRRRPFILRFWWAVPLLAVVVAAPLIWAWMNRPRPKLQPLPGYIANTEVLRQEYRRFMGKSLDDPDIEQQFEMAADNMLAGDYSSASLHLENTAKQAALPVVFNDLGVLYIKLNDGSRAINAFRDALARDLDYEPVRANLSRMKTFNAADPVTREVEPNGTNDRANVIALGRPVEADISPDVGDVDCFWFVSPPAPRDILVIEVLNRSKTLSPRLRVYDAGSRLLDFTKEAASPGASLRVEIAPLPNTTLYIHIDGMLATSGAYTLVVTPQKAFDAYEPNDDILNATKVPLGQTIDANIMDSNDTDYYSFVSPVAKTVAIDIRNRSKTLVPALATFTPDLRNSGFGPDVRTPGSNLHYALSLEANQTYYIQVWSQGGTSGAYSLTIQ